MIAFDYECPECGHQFEQWVEKTDEEVKCPKCKQPAKRLITNPQHYRHVSWSSWRVGHGD